ncbi:MAG: hypothetical protein NVS4B10_06960 [Myxococcales bacterium]
MAEYFRQFAFVASLLSGFSFAFFGTLLGVQREHRVVAPAAALALAASTCFLVVTLGNTFAAAALGDPEAMSMSRRLGITQAINRHLEPLSVLFLAAMLLLLLSLGAAGWARSRRLGQVTTLIAAAGIAGVVWVLLPFVLVR